MNTPTPDSPLDAATHADPYPYYAQLVRERPVYFDDALAAWVVSGADPVARVLQHEHCRVRPPAEPVPKGLIGSQAGSLFGNLVRMNDGERQRILKRLVTQALESPSVADLAATAATAARQTVVLTSPARPGSGLTDFCYQAPAQAMGLLLGLPQAEVVAAARLTSLLVRCISPGGTDDQIAAGREAARMLWDLFDELLARGPAGRRPGLLWTLEDIAMREGAAITRDDVISNAIGFMTQSFEATTGLIGNALRALAVDAGPARHDVGDAGAMAAFVHEVLRHDSPIQNTRRFATETFELAGSRIRAGDGLLLVLAAANRDPHGCPNPEVLDPGRSPAPLYSFGGARHLCPGQRMAETVAAAALTELLRHGVQPARLEMPVRFRRSVNARVPELTLAT